MRLRRRVQVTVWLGLIAMWLIVVAPLVSQLTVTPRVHNASLCSAVQKTGNAQDGSSDSPSACSYCDLLADQVAIPTLGASQPAVLPLLLGMAIVTLSTLFVPVGAFPSGRPRGPPSLASALHT